MISGRLVKICAILLPDVCSLVPLSSQLSQLLRDYVLLKLLQTQMKRSILTDRSPMSIAKYTLRIRFINPRSMILDV